MSDKELDAAMDLARETKRKVDTVRAVICSLQLALAELDILRPLHYGRNDCACRVQ